MFNESTAIVIIWYYLTTDFFLAFSLSDFRRILYLMPLYLRSMYTVHCICIWYALHLLHLFLRITTAVDGGLILGWKANFSSGVKFCTIMNADDAFPPSTDALTVAEFAGPFLILLIGIIIGLFVFIFERVRKNKTQNLVENININNAILHHSHHYHHHRNRI